MTKPKDVTQKTFQPHLLVVMGEMSEWTAGAQINSENTFKLVCDRMGISEDAYGTPANHPTLWTHRLIGFAMKNMRNHGWSEYVGPRGVWALTEKGIAEAKRLRDGGDPDAEESEMAEEEEEDDELVAEVSKSAAVADSDGATVLPLGISGASPSIHPYHDDPYLRALALKMSPCLGAFTENSPLCKDCPIQAECIAAQGHQKSALATQIEAQEKEHQRKMEMAKAEARRRDETVDELINLLGDEDPPDAAKETPKTSASPGGKASCPTGKRPVKSQSQRDGVCHHCSNVVKKDEWSWWIKGSGIYHLDCLDYSE